MNIFRKIANVWHSIIALAPIRAAIGSLRLDGLLKMAEDAALRFIDTTLSDDEKRAKIEALVQMRLAALGIKINASAIHVVVGIVLARVEAQRGQ